jgi:hydrogenase maturation protease
MKTGLLVIGYGNELRRDDAAGPRAAGAVAAWRLPGVEGIATHQLTPELAERIGEAERVVFVDAGQGDVVLTRPMVPGRAAKVLGHTGEPRELLALAEALYGRRPEAWLVTLPAPELGYGEGLSEAAEHGLADRLTNADMRPGYAEGLSEAAEYGLAEALRQIRTLAGAFPPATEEPQECTRSV